MPRIALRLLDAKEMARAISPHISRDNVTPALTVAALGGDMGSFVHATDRYTVGRYDLTNVLIDGAPDEQMWIPRAALSWITSVGKAYLVGGGIATYTVVITSATHHNMHRTVVEFIDDYRGEREETHLLRTFNAPTWGTFPPVWRMFDTFERGEQSVVGLTGEHLSKFAGYSRYRGEAMRVTLPVKSERAKHKPLHIAIGPRFQGLIMPVPVLDDEPPTPSSQDTGTTEENAS